MKNIVIILDPAHGKNVPGKCSPDGTHKEYMWSRERIKTIKALLKARGYDVFCTTESDEEPGLSVRKNFASSIKTSQKKLLISLHNNAAGSDGKWHSASGTCIYTTKGVTDSDACAHIILHRLERDFPDIKFRKNSQQKFAEDFEENFTVLMGNDYMACLVEWLFQDNFSDVEKLKNKRYNVRFEDSIVEAIEEINDYFKAL